MSEYSSNRQRNLKIGISSYTENQLVLDVTGNTNISGLSTIGGVTITPTGIITSSNPGVSTVVYYGDGSNLFGVSAFNVITQEITSSAVYPTFASNTGVSFVGISTNQFVFIPSSGNLGIGTTNPTSKLHVIGNALVTGVVTATTFIGNLTGTATTSTNLLDAANITTGTINKDRISTTNTLTVLGDLYVSNNISFGGTTTQLFTTQLNISDPDIVLGIGTSFSPTDNTANHGGIAIASTEGTPLLDLNIIPEETNPTTYKKIMWFKGDTIGAGLTDAWLFNYAVGIGSTRVPNGVRLAAGGVQFTENDLSTVRNINASGIITGSTFRPSSGYYQSPNGTNSFYVYDGTGNVAFQGTIGASQINSSSGYKAIDFTSSTTPFVNVTNGLNVGTGGTILTTSSNNIGIGTTNPTYKLHVVGSFGATTKSFVVPHPTKKGGTLQYGSLESPYHGIRLTGKGMIENGKCVVKLPEYISAFVKEDGVNIHITNIKHGEVLWVEEIDVANNNFTIQTKRTRGTYEFYWDFTAIRKDVADLVVEV